MQFSVRATLARGLATRLLIASWSMVGLAGLADAQTVYRCGPDGRSYGTQACDEGRAVRVDDVRSEAQRQQAERVARRDARGAQMLERDRLAPRADSAGAARTERRGRPAQGLSPAAKRLAEKKPRKKGTEDGDFRAKVPKPAKARPAPTA